MASQQEFQCTRCHKILRSHEIRDECPSAPRRHWGQYNYSLDTWAIQREWSCCLEEREDSPGCRRDAHDVIATAKSLEIQNSVQDSPLPLLESPVLDTSHSLNRTTRDQNVSTFLATKEQVDQEHDRNRTELNAITVEDNLKRQNVQRQTAENRDKAWGYGKNFQQSNTKLSSIVDDVTTNDRFTKHVTANRVRASAGNPVSCCSTCFCAKTTTEHSPVDGVFHVTVQSFPTFVAHHSNSSAAKSANPSAKRVYKPPPTCPESFDVTNKLKCS
ncbi:Hypp5206 [Branchiostoma lanceolatum]|uniref:Hypp5206 protein n=1 Tax=Branchiostoma lanceolatum TaxID=7740 RepID=A0A8K0AFK3_BRALA|nr:Hypp5206 [Branchiostoma lanceolatum]